jgi:hypothetical protein
MQKRGSKMDKLGVEISPEKVKEAEEKKGSIGQVSPKKLKGVEHETNVPWDPEKGTEPFEKQPEKK